MNPLNNLPRVGAPVGPGQSHLVGVERKSTSTAIETALAHAALMPFSPGTAARSRGGRFAPAASLSRRGARPPARPRPPRDGRGQWGGKGEWDDDPMHGDTRGSVRVRVRYTPSRLLRPLTLHCTRKEGIAENERA